MPMPPIPSPPPSKCTVYAFMENIVGISSAMNTAQLLVTLPQAIAYGQYMIRPGVTTEQCNQYGYVEAPLVEGVTHNFRYLFQIQYVDDNGLTQVTTLGWAQVPNQSSVDLSTLTFYQTADSLT